MRLDHVGGFLDGANLLGPFFVERDFELLFQRHHDFDGVQRIGAQVDKLGIRGDGVEVGAEVGIYISISVCVSITVVAIVDVVLSKLRVAALVQYLVERLVRRPSRPGSGGAGMRMGMERLLRLLHSSFVVVAVVIVVIVIVVVFDAVVVLIQRKLVLVLVLVDVDVEGSRFRPSLVDERKYFFLLLLISK